MVMNFVLVFGFILIIFGLISIFRPIIFESYIIFREKIRKKLFPKLYDVASNIGTTFSETKGSKINTLLFRFFGLMLLVVGIAILIIFFIR